MGPPPQSGLPARMGPDRQIVRLMAAMILAIIAYVAPTAVQAHGGHVHCGDRDRHQAAAVPGPAAPAGRIEAFTALPRRTSAMPAKLRTVPAIQAAATRPTASLRADDAGGGCCPGACCGSCCGTMVCCTFGIVAGHASLSVPLFRAVVLIPRDVAGRAGVGPEALRKPPRTLA